MKREIRSSSAPPPIGPYSQAVSDGRFVFCSGQVGLDAKTRQLAEGIGPQTLAVLGNLKEVLSASGLGLNDIVKTTVFLTSMDDFAAMNEEYSKHFAAPYPARSTVQVSALPRGAKVEIDAVALIPSG
jgi:2-iminobutanoate/2-iminopropanoate deaminase